MDNPKTRLIILVVIFLTSSCASNECYSDSLLENVTNFKVKVNRHTPNGTGIDDPANPYFVLDASEIDWQIDDFEACINLNFLENPDINAPEASCLQKSFKEGVHINRGCITVKVPDELYHSVCSGEWLFPCDIDDKYCREKGIEPTPECPCDCRATVQDNNVIITNHKLNLFRAELARMVTTCNNPWMAPQLEPCLNNPHFSGN